MLVIAANQTIEFLRPRYKIAVLTFFSYLALC